MFHFDEQPQILPLFILQQITIDIFLFEEVLCRKGDRDCYSVNVISECITQSFVICQKHKQKHSMCHSLQKISGFIA